MYKLNLLSILLFLISFNIVNAQDKPPVIEVTGNAEIKIDADIMEMFITINVETDDLQSGKNRNDESTGKVLAALKRFTIDDKDIVTSGVKMTKNYNSTTRETKYVVTNDISLKTSNISAYEDITTELIKIDNVFIMNTLLSSSKEIETKMQARQQALISAKKKAEDMADIYNMAIGKPILIVDYPVSYYPNPFNASTVSYSQMDYDRTQSIFKAGLISVSSAVKVIFLLMDR